MFHFLARVGRRPWTKMVMPFVGFAAGTSYLGVHVYGHQIVRNLFLAQSRNGDVELIGPELQDLIKRVFEEIKPYYNQPVLQPKFMKSHEAPTSWFCTTSMDPITYGLTETNTGVLIGLPNHYNYQRTENVPDSVFRFHKLSLFRSRQEEEKEEGELSPKDLVDPQSIPPGEFIQVDRNSPAAQDYVNSLVLSDEAKMFSIARELFEGDSYRPLIISALLMGSIAFSTQLSRAAVMKMRLQNAHVTQRMVMYMLAAAAGYINFTFISDMFNTYYTKQADERALKVSSAYRQGAVEFFNKLIQRNRALRDLDESFCRVYNDEGETAEPLTRFKHVPLRERLKLAEEYSEEETKE